MYEDLGALCECGGTCPDCKPGMGLWDPRTQTGGYWDSSTLRGLDAYEYEEGIPLESYGMGAFDPEVGGIAMQSFGIAGLGQDIIPADDSSATLPFDPSNFASTFQTTTSSTGQILTTDSGDLGQTAYDFATQFSGLIPVAGPYVQSALLVGRSFQGLLNIGAGRSEANIIVSDPNSGQNLLMQKIGVITNAFLHTPQLTTAQLQDMYVAVWTMFETFKRFVLSTRFRDRRASGQALNTVGPYIDGSCGYAVPLGQSATPTNSGQDCIAGVSGNWGPRGVLGALSDAIVAQGGAIPFPQITQGVGVPTLQYQTPDSSFPPQSGTIPVTQRYPLLSSSIIPIGETSGYLPLLLLAGAAFVFLRR